MFPLSLSKLKALIPVAVVGGAVAITIKLLTSETPQTTKLISAEATEDILETNYEEKLEDPVPEPEAEAVEELPEEEEGEELEEAEDEVSDNSGQEDSEKEQEEEEQKQEQDSPAAPRKLVDSPLGKLIGELINSK